MPPAGQARPPTPQSLQGARDQLQWGGALLLRRRWPVVLFVHNEDFAGMKSLATGSVSGMDHHRSRHHIAHVFHHPELTELVERGCWLIHDEDVRWVDQHARKGEALLFATG